MSEKVVLAYSGGLDTSVAIKWLKEKYDLDVIAVTIDVGNEKDFTIIKEKAINAGAIKAIVKDIKEDFVYQYIFPALKANALYQGQYSLATALARPLIAKLLVDTALEEDAQAIAHGCTGKGNDQVRFEVGVNTLAPHLKIIAPAREWGMTRDDAIKYAEEHGIPLPITKKSPYSIDENLWGRSIECGVLEDPWTEPPDDVFSLTKNPEDAPDEAEYIEISFDKGIPVELNGKTLSGLELISAISEIAGKHSIGRVDHIEDRLVGIKSREIYEAPAATLLLAAHKALESMTLSRPQLSFKEGVTQKYVDLIYDGLWFTALREDLDAFVNSTQRFVTGTVRLKLYKGSYRIVGRKSPYSLYHQGLATYDKGDVFNPSYAEGFMRLWGLGAQTQQKAQGIFDKEV